MSILIALSGAHASGKTTLCQEFAATLKKRNYSVGLVSGSSRSSHYLLSGDKSPEMHLEVFALQLLNELRSVRNYPIVLCDRSIYDFLAYARLRFGPENFAVRALSCFGHEYRSRYDLIMKTTAIYSFDNGDAIRRSETTDATNFNAELTQVFLEMEIQFHILPEKGAFSAGLEMLERFIETAASPSRQMIAR